MTTATLTEGWWWPINARKAHYMVGLTSLCGKWMRLHNNELDADDGTSADDCVACRRALDKRAAS